MDSEVLEEVQVGGVEAEIQQIVLEGGNVTGALRSALTGI